MNGQGERRRLAGIQVLRALEADGRPSLDRIIRLATSLTGASHAAVHIIDHVEQHRIAAIGVPLESSPREDSMCRLVIDSGAPVATADATVDARFDHAAAVRSDDPVRFFAASPLEVAGYGPMGTLCVWDHVPREHPEEVLANLEDLAALAIDILEAARAVRLLGEAAATDPLTGLPNRRLVHDTLTRALAAMQRRGAPVAVAYLDLDGFKAINDTHGHEVGDELLAGLATHLQAAVRSDELVGRIGGDEFVVVASAGLAQEEAVCRLSEAIARPIATSVGPQSVRASIGVVSATPGESAESLLRRADQAMFAVKRATPR